MEDNKYLLISIVAIVAVVGVIFLISNSGGSFEKDMLGRSSWWSFTDDTEEYGIYDPWEEEGYNYDPYDPYAEQYDSYIYEYGNSGGSSGSDLEVLAKELLFDESAFSYEKELIYINADNGETYITSKGLEFGLKEIAGLISGELQYSIEEYEENGKIYTTTKTEGTYTYWNSNKYYIALPPKIDANENNILEETEIRTAKDIVIEKIYSSGSDDSGSDATNYNEIVDEEYLNR